MKFAFRVDSSAQMGTGHIMRCLTLADELSERSAEVFFICRLLPGNLCEFVEKKGYLVHRLPYTAHLTTADPNNPEYTAWLGTSWQTDAEETKTVLGEESNTGWLVVDHYALDSRWEKQIRPYTKKIMTIDDLANRPHDCDLLLDQNLYEDMETRYDQLAPDYCIKLLGPEYALLRPEFKKARENLRQRDGTVKRVLIFFGGSDLTNETQKSLIAMQLLDLPGINVDVVTGGSNREKEKIERICLARPNTYFHCQVDNMAELMAKADLMIGAGGTATWERCFLGLPTITLVVAQNQADTTAAVAARGAAWNLGRSDRISPADLANAVSKTVSDPAALRKISLKALRLMGNLSPGSGSLIKMLMEG